MGTCPEKKCFQLGFVNQIAKTVNLQVQIQYLWFWYFIFSAQKYLGFYKIPNLLTLMQVKLAYDASEYQWLFEMEVAI